MKKFSCENNNLRATNKQQEENYVTCQTEIETHVNNSLISQ